MTPEMEHRLARIKAFITPATTRDDIRRHFKDLTPDQIKVAVTLLIAEGSISQLRRAPALTAKVKERLLYSLLTDPMTGAEVKRRLRWSRSMLKHAMKNTDQVVKVNGMYQRRE